MFLKPSPTAPLQALRFTVMVVLIPSVAWAQSWASDFVPPPGSSYINVQTDGGAVGDGQTDDTEALKAIFEAGKFNRHPDFGAARWIYLPNGTYKVSEPIRIGDKKKRIIGQSRDGVVIKLVDNAPEFQDPDNPTPVLSCVDSYDRWFFAQNFSQRVEQLTIDTGSGNPGAKGLAYHTNNGGDVFDVKITTSDPEHRGAIGLHVTGGPGPGLVHDVLIEGFDIGLQIDGNLHSMAFRNIRLNDQRQLGFLNQGNTVSIQGLFSDNEVTGLEHRGGHLAMTGGQFSGTNPSTPAVVLHGAPAFLRNLQAPEGSVLIEHQKTGQTIAGPTVDQFAYPKVFTRFEHAPKESLNLPIEDPPMVKLPQTPEDWTIVRPDGDNNLTDRLQKAIDDGAEAIWLAGRGEIRDTIHIRNRLRALSGPYRSEGFIDENKLIQEGDTVRVQPYERQRRPVLRIEDGASPVVLIKFFNDSYGDAHWDIDHASQRTLVCHGSGGTYINTVTGGKAFFLDGGLTAGSVINGPQQVWCWHSNVESYTDQPQILNNGGTLWILGLKSEKDRTIIETSNGGQTEMIGGFLYKNRQKLNMVPAFINRNSNMSVSYKVYGQEYEDHILEVQDGDERILPRSKTINRQVPLYNGRALEPSR